MKFLLINLHEAVNPHGSGGTERISKIAQLFEEMGNKCQFLGTIGLEHFLKMRNVKIPTKIVPIPLFLSNEKSKINRLLVYIWTSSRINRFMPNSSFDIVYSASDFFPDILGARLYKKNNPLCKWIAIIHHESKFNSGNIAARLSSIFSMKLQKISWRAIAKKADLVLFYDSNEGREISKSVVFEGKQKGFVRNGIDFDLIEEAIPLEFAPDILMCGGPRQSKGVMDIPRLLNLVRQKYPDITIGIAGHGTEKVISSLKRELGLIGMESNVVFLGNLPKKYLYSLMKSVRINLSLSYEEGWGIAMREAIICGQPCVAYGLAAFEGLENLLEIVPLGDIEEMAKMITKLLSTNSSKTRLSSLRVGQNWSEIASQEFELIVNKLL